VDVETPIPSKTSVYVLFYFYIDSSWTSTNGTSVVISEVVGGDEVYLKNSSGSLILATHSGLTGTHNLSVGTWHSIQMFNQAGSGNGVTTVWLDGTQEMSSSSLTLTGPFRAVYTGLQNASTQSGSLYFDDEVIATGSQIAAPAANITVRYPNTNARSAIPIDVVMWGDASSDILTASVDGATVYTQTGSMTGHQRFTVNLSGLSVGSHTFQVQLQNFGGTPKATFTGTLVKHVAGTPAVYIDANNNIYWKGSAYFPVAPFADGIVPTYDAYMVYDAVNTYGWQDCYVAAYAYTPATQTECLNALSSVPYIGPDNNWEGSNSANRPAGLALNQSGALTTAASYVTTNAGNPNMFMWTWVDEPDGGGGDGVLPPLLASVEQVVANNDGNHPEIENYTGGPSGAVTDRFSNYYYPVVPNSAVLPADVFSTDMYPYIYSESHDLDTVTQLVQSWDGQARYTYGLVPILAFIEGGVCNNNTNGCLGYGPTPAEVTMESWLGVIHGLKGVSWWGPGGYTTEDAPHGAAQANFLTLATTLTSYIDSATTLSVASSQTAQGSRVDVAAKQVGETVTVFATRLSDPDQAAVTNVAATSTTATYTATNYFSVGEIVAVQGLTNSALNCASSASCIVASVIGSSAPYTGFTIAGVWPSISSTPDSGTAVGNDSAEETQALSTTLTVSGSSFTGMAAVLNENRTAPVTDGVITDTFNSYATHIYQLSGPYTLSAETTGTGTGMVTNCAGAYSGGAFFSCTVTASAGSYIASVSGCSGSGTTTYSGTMPANNCIVTATVTQSVFSLAATTPAAVNPGAPATSTITVSTANGYAGTVTITCALTSYPPGATDMPTCSNGNATVTLTSTTATGTATFTVGTTAASASLVWPQLGPGRGWDGAGSGAILALLVFLGIPAKRRSWRSLIGMLVLIVALGSVAACGGGGGGGGSTGPSNPGTTAGTYTFTVTGTGSPSITPIPTTTFTLTVN
jgi:hypothetical protein